MDNDTTRLGVEINRRPNETWEALVVRYAEARNMIGPCIELYRDYIKHGVPEAQAALKSLAEFACTDLIIDNQHFSRETMVVN